MITRALDENNDWTFGKGRNNYKRDLDAVSQSVKTRLQSFLGDCFFAERDGIDWFNLLGSKDKTQLGLAVAAVILNTTDVTKIVNFEINLDSGTRDVGISYSIDTVYGTDTNSFQLDIGVL